ncbi:calmodulin [Echinococcus multilocularis]|uniref:Calmodulin n=1 Tax=Echinococcus multilocularis TaxID=6211 RepID=A0A068XVV4_ECHMU|nr:calmodulin [Echinococcus multilocularis]
MTQRPTGTAKENTKKARKSPMPASRGKENGECGVSKELHDAFVFFDVNHDGRITESELNSVLSFLGVKTSASEVKRMIADADIDGNGTVEYNEFIRMMNRYSEKTANCPDAEMLEAFRVFDRNNDAYIDHEEIKRTMHLLGETVSDDDVRAMIKEADADHDGLVDFEEFKRMMELKIDADCSQETRKTKFCFAQIHSFLNLYHLLSSLLLLLLSIYLSTIPLTDLLF